MGGTRFGALLSRSAQGSVGVTESFFLWLEGADIGVSWRALDVSKEA